ncbi:hypothetical protein sscle_03g027930 [Sclerotinia sclerotiorum 1980 UF-70]|uniref:Uncharacterized protein n=2 Tax=Sclerotinia sclerotiorum (strain ATCC 18683 / 1980 / Ss-1) TaxID=665079 RepID=A0A1D9Q0F8_SCLS1|nr:hypothetical protein sscle_03g027930 [Sclerotinia sclerotiorum 1980 UF-70]
MLKEHGEEPTSENLKYYGRDLQYITWIDFERDILFMHVDIFQMCNASETSLKQRIGKLHKHQLTLAKNLTMNILVAEDLVTRHSKFWQSLAVLCPKLVEVTIFTNDDEFSYPCYDFTTASRDFSRITRKTMNGSLGYYNKLKRSLNDCDELSYQVVFAHLELDEVPMPESPLSPEPNQEELELELEKEILDEELLSQWIRD